MAQEWPPPPLLNVTPPAAPGPGTRSCGAHTRPAGPAARRCARPPAARRAAASAAETRSGSAGSSTSSPCCGRVAPSATTARRRSSSDARSSSTSAPSEQQQVAGLVEEREPERLQRAEHGQDRAHDQPVGARPQAAVGECEQQGDEDRRPRVGDQHPERERQRLARVRPASGFGPLALDQVPAEQHRGAVEDHDRPAAIAGPASPGYDSGEDERRPHDQLQSLLGAHRGRSCRLGHGPTLQGLGAE